MELTARGKHNPADGEFKEAHEDVDMYFVLFSVIFTQRQGGKEWWGFRAVKHTEMDMQGFFT